MQWCFSQVKGAIDDDVAEGKTGDSGSRQPATLVDVVSLGCSQ